MRPHLLLLTIFLLLIAALATLNGALLLLALPFLLYFLADQLTAPGAPQVTVSRMLAEKQAAAGTPIEVAVTITNRGSRLAELEVRELLPPGLELVSGHAHWLLSLQAGEARTLTYTVRGRRGVYRFHTLQVTTHSQHDLIRHTTAFRQEESLHYYPAAGDRRLRQIDIRPRRTHVYSGSVPVRAGGEGTDFYTVRRYQSGDPLRRINWKASARTRDRLFTNDYEQERVADVGIIVDVRRASNLPHNGHSLLDYSVAAAASLSAHFLGGGNRVALLNYGGFLDYTLPGYGRVQQRKILYALTRARLGESAAFSALAALPTTLFPAGSQIVFISPLLEDDVRFLRRLRARDYRVMVISPNPVIYEQALLEARSDGVLSPDGIELAARLMRAERALLLRQLLQSGIFALDWNVEETFEEAAATQWRALRLLGARL
ncbi:MAG: DUF58 domain-containing protein [Candidatus Promineifilaceae bacterium]|nr:DUF58 domain-containing protein [Candidatus Promineifilaceae bacterium]